jgi:hypothetical protein
MEIIKIFSREISSHVSGVTEEAINQTPSQPLRKIERCSMFYMRLMLYPSILCHPILFVVVDP